MKDFLKTQLRIRPWVATGVFFLIFLGIGLAAFQDYGVHWDEYNNQKFGRRWADYSATVLRTGSLDTPLPKYKRHDLTHGPAFEVFLSAVADLFKLKDSRDVILMRHLCVFLLFYIGVGFFYLLCRKHFQSSWLALLGCIFLVLSPRIFADAFYNSVDIPFLVFFIIGIFTLLNFLDKKTFLTAAAHALVCAILMNIRLMGLFLSFLSIIFFGLEVTRMPSVSDKMAGLRAFVGWLLLFGILAVLFNPFLWTDPFGRLSVLVSSAVNFNKGPGVHYLGTHFTFGKMPWHYALVWIPVSTPIMYEFLFLGGMTATVMSFFGSSTVSYVAKRNSILFLSCFFLPLVVAAGKIYNGWRHIYFIYPFLLVLAIIGLQYMWEKSRLVVRAMLIIGVVFGLLDTAFFMIRNHPYQNLYFNRLAGGNPLEITERFELDYWGLSFRRAEEYILKTDKGAWIPLCFSQESLGQDYMAILPLEDRKRLSSQPVRKAKYFLTNEMAKLSRPSGKEYYSITVDGMKIMTVYKLDHVQDEK